MLHHHERVDGTGYPDRLREADLAPITQLAAVVEVFSAMTQSRSYGRAAHPAQVAREILREIGTAFEQGAALALIQCVAVYPVGSAVQLNTGEYALVTSSALGHAMRPNVRVFYDANGQRIRPYDLNMVENSGYHITRYASTLEELKSHPSSEKEGMEQLGEFAA